MNKENYDIRIYAKERGVLLGEIASSLYISREHFSRLMKKPLTDKMRKQVMEAIDKLADEVVDIQDLNSTKYGIYRRGFIAGEQYARKQILKEITDYLKGKGEDSGA